MSNGCPPSSVCRSRGFSLESLSDLFAALEAGRSLADVLGVAVPARRPARRDEAELYGFSELETGRPAGCAGGAPAALHRPYDDVGRERGLLISGPCPMRRSSCRGRAHVSYGAAVAVTTRHGGVSPAPYDTLNLGLHVGDDPERVQTNRNARGSGIRRRPRGDGLRPSGARHRGRRRRSRRGRARHPPGGATPSTRPTSSSPVRPW